MTDDELLEQVRTLTSANKKLSREIERERSLNNRNRVRATINTNLGNILSAEKSRLEKYMNLLLSNSTDVVLIFDTSAKLLFASASFLSVCGAISVGEIRGNACTDVFETFLSGDSLRHANSAILSSLAGAQLSELDLTVKNSADQIRYFKMQVSPMLDQSGASEGAMVLMYDTTDLYLARLASEAARSEAVRASIAKSDFLANMSHEMRTPLNAVIGMTAIARQSADPERMLYCLGKIEDASTHLLGVINDILDMSKIEANKLELSPTNFTFERMLAKTAGSVGFKADDKKQTLKVWFDPAIPSVIYGDEQRLSQVIMNLLSNAVKFTPEGGNIEMNAVLLFEDAGSCCIQVDVTDTGIGISDEQKAKLFSSFQQADSSTSRKFGGTGLGLAISKRIVEMMGGSIWIRSEPGEGSTFSFTVRLVRVDDSDRKKYLAPGTNLANATALVVDDVSDALEHFLTIANEIGLNCETVSSAPDALRRIREHGKYDFYFIDWKMPDVDGIELTREIRLLSPDESVVIMISSAEWQQIAEDATAAGVNRFLPKPLFAANVIDCINECLAGYGGGEDSVEGDDFTGYRILIAEDIEINREIVMTLLEPTNLRIDCAENGLIAFETFRDDPELYDMIFMDVQMPELDGYGATRQIRALDAPCAKTIPIIAMTANVFREDVEKCLESGMNDHVGKPIDINDVRGKLRRYLPSVSSSAKRNRTD
ncbi:MAG: response regulator [Oscillospiraceae bacterium]|jgi:signal transduction histidine kinase/DNA-binding response OmpR family regulator|nr:response regulator [Oscillospiraceae bacterium]